MSPLSEIFQCGCTTALIFKCSGKKNWYERYENNGWRLVTDRVSTTRPACRFGFCWGLTPRSLYSSLLYWSLSLQSHKLPTHQDPITTQSSQERKPFHHSRVSSSLKPSDGMWNCLLLSACKETRLGEETQGAQTSLDHENVTIIYRDGHYWFVFSPLILYW